MTQTHHTRVKILFFPVQSDKNIGLSFNNFGRVLVWSSVPFKLTVAMGRAKIGLSSTVTYGGRSNTRRSSNTTRITELQLFRLTFSLGPDRPLVSAMFSLRSNRVENFPNINYLQKVNSIRFGSCLQLF